MSITGEPGGAAGEGRHPAHRSRRRPVRARRHPRRARAPAPHRRRASTSTRRSSTPASRCRCGRRPSTSPGIGVPARAGIGAPDERAVSGDSLRRRLHHARRRQRAAVPAAVRGARPSGVGRRCPSSPTTRAASGNREALAGADRSDHRRRSRARTGWRCSTRTTSRAGRSTTTRRCSRTRRSSRARWWSRPSIRRSGACRTLGSPIKMSATPPDVSRRAPLLGEHTDEVLREAGIQRRGDRGDCGESGAVAGQIHDPLHASRLPQVEKSRPSARSHDTTTATIDRSRSTRLASGECLSWPSRVPLKRRSA